MYIGRVKGNVVSTIKHSLYEGRKLMLVARLNLDGSEADAYDICLDDVQAGVGDVVVVLDEGSSARQVIGKRGTGPARAIIVGIVDAVELRDGSPQPDSKKRRASGRRRAQAGS
ncbi:MAG: EutN/CcmL family microcompartment protein [Anaerolineae bacterium]|nr:EutN/CcmL family microcompartment protein [Anaerolineae bacterium]